ncbi:MAG: hypothetical protein AAF723_10370, partial [Pseudomonadota bacterium]
MAITVVAEMMMQSGQTNEGQKTVLIVEDNELNMKLFHDLLDVQGYRILQANNGNDAFDIAKAHHPD